MATLVVVGVLGAALSSIVGAGGQAASTVTSGAATTAISKAGDSIGGSFYFVDSLLRPADPLTLPANADVTDTSAAQIATILANGAVSGSISPDDQARQADPSTGHAGVAADKRGDGCLDDRTVG